MSGDTFGKLLHRFGSIRWIQGPTRGCEKIALPDGPSNQYLRFLVPKTIC